MPRSIMEKMDAIQDELEAILVNPSHSKPRCGGCHHLLHLGELRQTTRGLYEDADHDKGLCAFCKADRDQLMQYQASDEVEEDEYADVT